MYNHIYEYYYICHDKPCSKYLDTNAVIDYLLDFKELKQISSQLFMNNNGFAFISIGLALSINGNYAISEYSKDNKINLIEIICDKNHHHHDLLLKIAHHFSWQLYQEIDDEWVNLLK